MRHSIIILLLLFGVGCTSEETTLLHEPEFTPSDELSIDFLTPPSWSHPRVFWWWLYGNISREGILNDLSEMKKAGIGGAIVFDAGGAAQGGTQATSPGHVFMSDEWCELFTYACRVADSLDLELSMSITSGWNDGGPWVTPEESAKKVVWSEHNVTGPILLSEKLPLPEGLLQDTRNGGNPYFKPVATLAVPVTENSASVAPPENLALKAVHSIRIPKTRNGRGFDWGLFLKEEPSIPGDYDVRLNQVIDLSDKVDAGGDINWQVPEGEWIILRFGYTGTGARVSTHSPGGGGLAIDYLSKEALDLQYANTVGKILAPLLAEGIESLRYLHDDSWELGAANWTHGFDEEFKKRTGYDITPYLPVLAGMVVENRDVSNRFLYDFRRTIADLIGENHYGYFSELAHADGMGIHPESGGPHPAPFDALKNLGRNDIPMGEFWIRANTHRVSPQDRFFVKQSASAAHIYGKRFVQAEGPTSIGPHWEEDFAYMKPTLDRVYCEGLNRLVIHTWTHSPAVAGIPGNEYFAGTHFNQNVTWWKQASAFLAWNSRNSFMLAQGLFVGDVCYYYGDNVPNQVPLKHVKDGLGEGYDYDVCNSEIILNSMSVKDGRIQLESGMSYEILVIPDCVSITSEVMAKLEKLVRAGATIVGPKPTTAAGLRGYRGAEYDVRRIADAMWGGSGDGTVLKRRYGKGFVCMGMTEREVLVSKGVRPDFTYASSRDNALVDYIHRATDREDIYYVVNRMERPEYLHLTFRSAGRAPELWNPIDGSVVNQPVWSADDGLTSMPLFLEPFGSMFVVFRKKSDEHYRQIAFDGRCLFPELPRDTFPNTPFMVQKGGQLLLTEPGEYTLTRSDGEELRRTVAPPAVMDISTLWDVSFDPRWGGPQKIHFDELSLWNTHPDSSIRYYSGSALYTRSFRLTKKECDGKRVFLDLGELYNLAEVTVNGDNAGVWWQPPFSGEITGLLRDGDNQVEIEVVNLWPNRLIGDNYLPDGERFTRTNVGKFNKDYPLRNSGLAGPVKIVIYNSK